MIQEGLLYLDDPQLLRHQAARYAKVDAAAVTTAVRRWLAPSAMVEVETVALRAGSGDDALPRAPELDVDLS